MHVVHWFAAAVATALALIALALVLTLITPTLWHAAGFFGLTLIAGALVFAIASELREMVQERDADYAPI